jgi:hypothetical protein
MLYAEDYEPVPLAYYPEPYPNYYYPTATFFAGVVTGAIFGAVVDWDNWSVWGGRLDGNDIDIDCNKGFNNIDVNGKLNFNDVDWKNVDRSKIKFDRDQFAKLDRTNVKKQDRGRRPQQYPRQGEAHEEQCRIRAASESGFGGAEGCSCEQGDISSRRGG